MTATSSLMQLRELEFTDREVEAVLARAGRSSRSRRGRAVLALAALAAVAAGTVAAVPAGRAGLSDAVERFFAGGPTPGAPLRQGQEPRWLARLGSAAKPRVLASSGRERLIAYRPAGGGVCFTFGGDVGMCSDNKDPQSLYRDLFSDEPVWPFGPTERDAEGRWVLWGVALDSVKRVELLYSNAPPTAAQVTNGFVLRADADAKTTARTLVAFGAEGRELARIDVRRRFELAPVGG